MIKKTSVDKVIDIARVEEVVGDFVTLKKRGVNYIACCPFHNEKTPSFTVSPTKGIYKCFGCGKAGNSVKFLMEHEKHSFVEAIRQLADKYQITLEETEDTEEQKQARDLRESLFIVNNFVQQHYSKNLTETEEGKNIGLSYFKERGFRDEIIEKFQLGYSFENGNDLVDSAKSAGHNLEYLEQLGHVKNFDGNHHDFFRGRVMFTIQNHSGKVVAFAGRLLKKDVKAPKYVNSPDSDVYNKSRVLYGLNFAKHEIARKNVCYLVEGYTDVISLFQAGIENVVASSGTALTVEQITLVKRFTPNITVLFDGDAAGLKAALRGIDLILAQDMNVRIVQLPKDEDPDSFVQSKGAAGFEEYIKNNEKDFILFKTGLLMKDVKDDPVRKSELIQDIVSSIAKIPDPVKVSLYVKECSRLMDIEERILTSETNKKKRSHLRQQNRITEQEEQALKAKFERPAERREQYEVSDVVQEKDIIRILIEYGDKSLHKKLRVCDYLFTELPQIDWNNKNFEIIANDYKLQYDCNALPEQSYFINHKNPEIAQICIDLLTTRYHLSKNWNDMHDIQVHTLEENYQADVVNGIMRFKLTKLDADVQKNLAKMKNLEVEYRSIEIGEGGENTEELNAQKQKLKADLTAHQKLHKQLLDWRKEICADLSTVILK